MLLIRGNLIHRQPYVLGQRDSLIRLATLYAADFRRRQPFALQPRARGSPNTLQKSYALDSLQHRTRSNRGQSPSVS